MLPLMCSRRASRHRMLMLPPLAFRTQARLCACFSERKRKQMSELQHRVNQLEATNASLNKLLAQRDQELATLRNGAHNRAPH